MAHQKNDLDLWRQRVDRKLNDLSRRMNSYESAQQSHMTLTQQIADNVSALVARTQDAVAITDRISNTKSVLKWMGKKWKNGTERINRNAIAMLSVLTVLWVWEHAHGFVDAWEKFIQTFNGTTR